MKHPVINEEKKLASLLMKIIIVGIALTGYLTYLGLFGINPFCNLSSITCSANTSIATDVSGFSIALFALATCIIVLGLTIHVFMKSHIKGHLGKRISSTLIVIILFLATIFSAYMILLQEAMIGTYCLLCILVALDIIVSFVVSIILFKEVVR